LQKPQRIPKGGPVEGAYLDAGVSERLPIAPGRGPAPHPVIQDPYLDARPRPFGQRIPKAKADRIVPEDIVLEVYEAAGKSDG
jgi:hypothetical protein